MSGARVVGKALPDGCKDLFRILNFLMWSPTGSGEMATHLVASRLITDMRLPASLVQSLTAFRPLVVQSLYDKNGIKHQTGRPKNSFTYIFSHDRNTHLVAGVFSAVLLRQLEAHPVDGKTLLTARHVLTTYDILREHSHGSVLLASVDWERVVWATIGLLKNKVVLDNCASCRTPFLRTHTRPSWPGGIGCPCCHHHSKQLAPHAPGRSLFDSPLWQTESVATAASA